MRTVALLLLALVCAARTAAQEPWLTEVPTAQKVAGTYQADASRLGAAKAAEAMYALTNVIGSLSGPAGLSPAAKGRMAELSAGHEAVLNAQYEKDRETYKVAQCEQAYAESPEFHRELLDQFFSPQWISTYGPRLDVRRWKKPLALPAGTRPPADLLPACGPEPAQVAGSSPPVASAGAQPNRRSEAIELFGKGEWSQAIAILEPLAVENPDDQVTLAALGTSYGKLGRPADAVPVLRRATRVATDRAVLVLAHQQLAYASLALGQRDAAIESWRALMVLDTTVARGIAIRIEQAGQATAAAPAAGPARSESAAATAEADGLKRMAAKDYKGARKAFRAAIAADPKRASAFAHLGDTWYAEMLALAGGKDSVAYSRAFDLAWDSSSTAWEHAVALKPRDAKLLVEIGDRQRELDPSTGFEAYSQALDLKPDVSIQSRAWTGLGWMARFLTMDKDAVTYFNNAARLDWKNADAAYGLGLSLAKAGAKGPAMAQYRKLLQLGDSAKAGYLLEEINKP